MKRDATDIDVFEQGLMTGIALSNLGWAFVLGLVMIVRAL